MSEKEQKGQLTLQTEIKEKVNFAFVIQDRLFVINKSFDSNDKYRIREAWLFSVTDLLIKN